MIEIASSTSSGKKKTRRRQNAVPLLYPDQTYSLPTITPDNTFFTADTHFYSTGIIKHRPRFTSIEEMNDALIRRWNETVPEDGVVFHLGDLATELPKAKLIELINQLHGTILLIKGNHDDVGIYRCKEIQASTRFRFLGYQWELWLERKKILLNHYPYLCYAGEHEGVWQLFGHVHSGSDKTGYDIPRLRHLLPFQYDVGVDSNSYRPISFCELKEKMAERKAKK
jgi:calcineurin-like phosphoesterase family protein